MSGRLCIAAIVVAILGSLQVGADEAKVKELRKERLATLKDVEAQTEQAFQAGRAPFNVVLAAKAATLEAELDLCQTQEERIAILEKLVGVAKNAESHATAAAEMGKVPLYEALKTKASRLAVEIALEKLRQK
jgi:hypothetical protein